MELLDILNAVSVINRDNGSKFTKTDRLDAISSILWNSKYRRVNADGLFNLYAIKSLAELKGREVVVVSSHIDCESGITQCFSQKKLNGILKGTYDNSITNAAILSLMLKNDLSENVLVAFTGDEERNSNGAHQLYCFLQKNNIKIKHIFVLDVTDMGWKEEADYTIENNF